MTLSKEEKQFRKALGDAQARRIRSQMVLEGVSSRDLAKRFGVGEAYVSRIIHGSSTGPAAAILLRRINAHIASSLNG